MDARIREHSASAADAHEAASPQGLSHGAGGNVSSQCNMLVQGRGKREKRPSTKALRASASADDAEDSARAVKRKKPQDGGAGKKLTEKPRKEAEAEPDGDAAKELKRQRELQAECARVLKEKRLKEAEAEPDGDAAKALKRKRDRDAEAAHASAEGEAP